jgi:hypothetical protein
MAQQQAGAPIPDVPDPALDASGVPTGNPSPGYPDSPPVLDGYPVSPAVARPRAGGAAAHGHGADGAGPGGPS